MAEQQITNAQSPAPVAPASVPTTPEAADTRIKELMADPEWRTRYTSRGKDSREGHELDALQRIACGAANTGAPEVSQPYSIPAGMSAEDARTRIEEIKQGPDFAKYFIAGSREARELDALTRHSLGMEPEKSGAVLTPEQARAAALNEVPKSPEGYEIDWRDASPGDPVPEEGVKAITSWAHGAGLTQSEASTMIHYAGHDVAKWQRMDDAARELHMSDSIARFNKMHGDQAPAMLDGARRLVAELCQKDSTLKSFLEDSGAGASLAVISALADAASRRYGTQRPSGVTPKRPVAR